MSKRATKRTVPLRKQLAKAALRYLRSTPDWMLFLHRKMSAAEKAMDEYEKGGGDADR